MKYDKYTDTVTAHSQESTNADKHRTHLVFSIVGKHQAAAATKTHFASIQMSFIQFAYAR